MCTRRSRTEIEQRLDKLKDTVVKCQDLSVDLETVSGILDLVESNCEQLYVDIGPAVRNASVIFEVAQVSEYVVYCCIDNSLEGFTRL
jgi:hypothetical protein